MKTTVELPDDLLIEAKKRAAELRRPLRSLIEEGLRRQLRALEDRDHEEPMPLRWVTADGGLPADLNLSDRAEMSDWMMRRPAAGCR